MRHHVAASSPTSSGGDVTTPNFTPSQDLKRGKRRGSYSCGRCGQPKKGHVCHIPPSASTSILATPTTSTTTATSGSTVGNRLPPRQPYSRLPRALSFDNIDVGENEVPAGGGEEYEPDYFDLDDVVVSGRLPGVCLWEVLRKLPPADILSAARVCKGWRECTRRLWKAAEELKLRVPVKAQVGFIGSVLQKCTGLVRLTLRMESDVDATILACIAFSCPNLESLEIFKSNAAINRITGDELDRFVADRRRLTCLKMEGCSNIGSLVITSTSLSTLWLSDLHSLSKTVINCPNLREVSLDFVNQENDHTDLTTMIDSMGRYCPRLQNIHIASARLTHSAVLALTAANWRALRMLSLMLSSGITDASVAAITSSYSRLELLDLSGSSISDGGIGMICNVYTHTLSRLLLALCPNVTSSGIQFATAQLPLLELMDCGMTICDLDSDYLSVDESNDCELQKSPNRKLPIIYQKLIIKHSRLKKLSLWGCSGLDALYLNCPLLTELNLNSCWNLHSERLLLQCPNLDSVHATGCQPTLVETIESQIKEGAPVENYVMNKRMPDGSKRIRMPHFLHQQSFDENAKRRRVC